MKRFTATIAILSALFFLLPHTQAVEIPITDGVTLSVDSTISAGLSVRTEDRDDGIIGRANGGTFNSVNYDNGNLNYDSGDIFSAPLKLTQEMNMDLYDTKIFGRWTAFYDFAIMDGDTERTELGETAENNLGYDIRLLDLFATHDFDVGGKLVQAKAGNIVLNWGETLFIQNGINQINPIRVPALRLAGAELREGLIPVTGVDLNFEVADGLSAEAFYLFEFDNTTIEPEGTFFSINDFASPGGDAVMLGFGAIDNPAAIGAGTGLAAPVGVGVRRGPDRHADDQGQFGLALRYLAEELNSSEIGLYWTHLHSRLPLLSATTATPAALAAGDFASGAEYFREFPEDLDTFGVSFNTAVGETAVAGEVAYHVDRPLQIDEVELLYAALSPIDLASGDAVFSRGQLGQANFGDEITGYREKDVVQVSFNTSKFLDGNLLGSDSLLVLGEVGATYVDGLESKDELRYNGPGTDTGGGAFFTAAGIQPETQTDGFADDFSWGYRLVARSEYNNAIGSVNLQPTLAFRHDVTGTTPGPGGNFVEDRMQVTAGLGATFQQNLQGNVSYTNFFGGDEFNQLNDRDFVTISTSYSF